MPSARRPRIVSQARRRAAGSKPVVGSSRKTSSGSPTSARPRSSGGAGRRRASGRGTSRFSSRPTSRTTSSESRGVVVPREEAQDLVDREGGVDRGGLEDDADPRPERAIRAAGVGAEHLDVAAVALCGSPRGSRPWSSSRRRWGPAGRTPRRPGRRGRGRGAPRSGRTPCAGPHLDRARHSRARIAARRCSSLGCEREPGGGVERRRVERNEPADPRLLSDRRRAEALDERARDASARASPGGARATRAAGRGWEPPRSRAGGRVAVRSARSSSGTSSPPGRRRRTSRRRPPPARRRPPDSGRRRRARPAASRCGPNADRSSRAVGRRVPDRLERGTAATHDHRRPKCRHGDGALREQLCRLGPAAEVLGEVGRVVADPPRYTIWRAPASAAARATLPAPRRSRSAKSPRPRSGRGGRRRRRPANACRATRIGHVLRRAIRVRVGVVRPPGHRYDLVLARKGRNERAPDRATRTEDDDLHRTGFSARREAQADRVVERGHPQPIYSMPCPAPSATSSATSSPTRR